MTGTRVVRPLRVTSGTSRPRRARPRSCVCLSKRHSQHHGCCVPAPLSVPGSACTGSTPHGVVPTRFLIHARLIGPLYSFRVRVGHPADSVSSCQRTADHPSPGPWASSPASVRFTRTPGELPGCWGFWLSAGSSGFPPRSWAGPQTALDSLVSQAPLGNFLQDLSYACPDLH